MFDAAIATLQFAAQNLTWMLKQVTGCQVVPIQLGVVETEEDLWGGLALRHGKAESTFEWQQGLLAGGREQELRLVIIPDLTRLSLPAARACVALMGSEIAHLERHGHHDRWQPNLCWLAGCPRQEVGLASPHLLDRFALRLSSQEYGEGDRAAAIRQWLYDSDSRSQEEELLLPEWMSTLQQAKSRQPDITLEAQKQVLDYIASTDGYSVRRELALLRLAQANAQLAGEVEVTAQQVDLAAQMIGLALTQSSLDIARPEPEKPKPAPDLDSPAQAPVADAQSEMERRAPTPIQEPVYASDTTATLPPQPIALD